MSAPRSKLTANAKRFGKLATNYQEKINRQADSIDRLLKALEVAQFTLYTIANEDKNIKSARATASMGSKAITDVLAVHKEEAK